LLLVAQLDEVLSSFFVRFRKLLNFCVHVRIELLELAFELFSVGAFI
jgi:hypothetical protein